MEPTACLGYTRARCSPRSAWLVLALLHVLPALALFRPALLTRLYGAATGSDIALLLQHRAALFWQAWLST